MADIFGMGEQPPTGSDDDDEGVTLTIHQIIPADPGWRAVFEEDNGKTRVVALTCFALVELHHSGDSSETAIRPMVADEEGHVDDVEAYDDFFCLVPPGAEPKTIVERVRKLQQQRSKEAEA